MVRSRRRRAAYQPTSPDPHTLPCERLGLLEELGVDLRRLRQVHLDGVDDVYFQPALHPKKQADDRRARAFRDPPNAHSCKMVRDADDGQGVERDRARRGLGRRHFGLLALRPFFVALACALRRSATEQRLCLRARRPVRLWPSRRRRISTPGACGPCAREIKIAPFHTWGYEGRPWTSNDCAQASHTEKNARAHDFSQKRCDAYDRSRPPVNAARTHFAPRDSCRPYIQHVRCASMTYNTV